MFIRSRSVWVEGHHVWSYETAVRLVGRGRRGLYAELHVLHVQLRRRVCLTEPACAVWMCVFPVRTAAAQPFVTNTCFIPVPELSASHAAGGGDPSRPQRNASAGGARTPGRPPHVLGPRGDELPPDATRQATCAEIDCHFFHRESTRLHCNIALQ